MGLLSKGSHICCASMAGPATDTRHDNQNRELRPLSTLHHLNCCSSYFPRTTWVTASSSGSLRISAQADSSVLFFLPTPHSEIGRAHKGERTLSKAPRKSSEVQPGNHCSRAPSSLSVSSFKSTCFLPCALNHVNIC